MSKNRLLLFGLGALLVVAIGGVLVRNSSKSVKSQPGSQVLGAQNIVTMSPMPMSSSSLSPLPSASGDSTESADEAGVKEFTVTGSNYKFEPSTLAVKKGDKVKITFKNAGGFHDLVIDKFNVKTPIIKSGDQASIEFTADKTGTFQYYCSVGNHRAMGMVGTLTVQ